MIVYSTHQHTIVCQSNVYFQDCTQRQVYINLAVVMDIRQWYTR
jgi:hypothetical protein